MEKEREEEERESIDRFARVQNRVWGDLSVFAVMQPIECVWVIECVSGVMGVDRVMKGWVWLCEKQRMEKERKQMEDVGVVVEPKWECTPYQPQFVQFRIAGIAQMTKWIPHGSEISGVFNPATDEWSAENWITIPLQHYPACFISIRMLTAL